MVNFFLGSFDSEVEQFLTGQNRNFLNQLLYLCTKDQQDRFSELYPAITSKEQIKEAQSLVLKTLISNKTKLESLEKEVKELKEQVIDLQAENCQLQCNLDECKTPKESQDYQDICSLNEGLEITNNQYKKNSLKLQALENLGVDDWDGYDDAMDDYRELLKSNCIEDDD